MPSVAVHPGGTRSHGGRLRLIGRAIGIAPVVIAAILFSSIEVEALEGPLDNIDQPVPAKWREPAVDFLNSIGIKDGIRIINEIKSGYIRSVSRPDSIVFRIEDKTTCKDDICLTIIARLIEHRIVEDAMFVAGPQIEHHDVGIRVLSVLVFPEEFLSVHGNMLLLDMPVGWIVVPVSK